MTDVFDTPVSKSPAPGSEDAARAFTARMKAAAAAIDKTLDDAGRPFTGLAERWKREADRRASLRSESARQAVIEANKDRRDAMRDLRRDRKAFEKARDEVGWWNVFNGERRAARSVVRDSRELAREASSKRREAVRAYPATLAGLAVRCHAAHLVPTGVWAAVTDGYASTGAFTASVAAVAVNVAGVALGMRHVADVATDAAIESLQPSQEERDLLHRLDPVQWTAVADPRGLTDVMSAGATLTDSGITARLTLKNQMSVDKLTRMEEQLRAALRLKASTRLELRPGKTGGHARLTLRTRSAADGITLTGWEPGDPWAINTVTGEPVRVPLGRRMLVAGTSGSGKSWSMRPVLAEASAYDDHRLVVLDMKRVEARLWEHRACIGVTADEILYLTDELVAEMYRRLDLIPRGQDVVQISPTCPRITIFVDEGGELISASKVKSERAGKDDDPGPEYKNIVENLRTIARMGRAAEIVLLWATQKPTLSGEGHGIDSQIAGQITCRASLCVSTQTESQVVFGNDAIEKGWKAHELPMPGYAMLRDSNTAKPEHLKTRAFSPNDVIRLPDRPIWSRNASSTGATVADIKARQAAEKAPVPQADPWGKVTVTEAASDPAARKSKVSATDRDDQVMSVLSEGNGATLSDVARALEASKSSIKASLDRLTADGLVERSSDGRWSPTG